MVLGNVAILVGSGIIGSVLTSNDGKVPGVGDVFSGAAKFVKNHGKEGKDASSTSDPHTAQLMSQVNCLREEIKYLASRPVTVVTGAATSGRGAFTITAVVVAGVIGYAYIKWKGWKLSGLMFVTKRGLSDACNVVGSQLDQVSDSVIVTRRHLAGRIDRVDTSLDETQQIIEGTRDEVAVIHGDLSAFQEDLQTVNLVVRNLESKLGNLEYTQDCTVNGISELVDFTQQRVKDVNICQVTSSIPPAIGSSSERILKRGTPLLLQLPQAPQTVSPVAESSPRVEASQEKQGFLSRTSSPGEGSSSEPSNGGLPSTEASMSAPNASSSRFGGLKLPGLGYLLRSSAS